jgi:hypothetical protein
MSDELLADVEALDQEQVDVVLPAPEPLSTSTAGLACPHCDSLETAVQEVEDAEVGLSGGGEKLKVVICQQCQAEFCPPPPLESAAVIEAVLARRAVVARKLLS